MNLRTHLTALEAFGFLRLASSQPDLEYLFRHALIQDAAYSSLVKADRQTLHRMAGEALEQLYPDRPDELAGELAHHFAEAGEHKRAIEYSRRAAARAAATFAYDEAIRHLRTALDLAESHDQPETRMLVLEELADIYRLVRDGLRAISLYQQALAGWRDWAGGSRQNVVRLHRKILQALAEAKWSVEAERYQVAQQVRATMRGNVEAQLLALQDQEPDPETVRLFAALSTDSWRNQDPPDWGAAQCYAQSAVDMAERLDSSAQLTLGLAALADVWDARSLLRQHLQVAQRRLEVVQGPGFDDIRQRLDAVRGFGMALMYVGEYRQALEHLQEAENLARRIQAVNQEFNALSLQSQCFFRLDRWDEVLAVEGRWRPLGQRHGLRTGPT